LLQTLELIRELSSSILTTMSSSIISEEAGVQEEARQLEAKQKISPFDDFSWMVSESIRIAGENRHMEQELRR